MRLENQCVSLEIAKRLRELGVKQDGIVTWAEYPHLMQQQDDGTSKCIETITQIRGNYYWREDEIDTWSAFTATELGEMLPELVKHYWLCIEKNEGPSWSVSYDEICSGDHCETYYKLEACSLANAMAQMLIYLIENKLVEVKV